MKLTGMRNPMLKVSKEGNRVQNGLAMNGHRAEVISREALGLRECFSW